MVSCPSGLSRFKRYSKQLVNFLRNFSYKLNLVDYLRSLQIHMKTDFKKEFCIATI